MDNTDSAEKPSLFEIAGKHFGTFDALYHEMDPENSGFVSASDAGPFLKRSNLSVEILGTIWDISDYRREGRLDKLGFFTALKLVALAQQDQIIATESLTLDIGPPDISMQAATTSFPVPPGSQALVTIKQSEREKYDAIFDSLEPKEGKLSGAQVRPVLLNSGLPATTLGKIWDLSDVDKDGLLDREEMAIALHLVYRALENDPVPAVLPSSLVPPGKRVRSSSGGRRTSLPTDGAPVIAQPGRSDAARSRPRATSVTAGEGLERFASQDAWGLDVVQGETIVNTSAIIPTAQEAVPVAPPGQSPSAGSRSLTSTPISVPSVRPPIPWVVDKPKWESTFLELDSNQDGLVSGLDVKHVLLQSGLAQNYLAHIWSLVDLKKTGMLNSEQFALAMHLIEQKREYAQEPPADLPPDLIPPSFRPSPAGMTDISTSTQELDANQPSVNSVISATGNKEIDSLAAEISGLQGEKRHLESAVVQLEADMTVKQSEIKNLEVELNTLDSTVKQLERQKAEAQRRLDDLDTQREALCKTFEEMQTRADAEQVYVRTIGTEVEQTALSARDEEDQLNMKRAELQSMREEESRLQVRLQNENANLDTSAQQYGVVETRIHQADSNTKRLTENTEQLKEHLAKLEKLLKSADISQLVAAEDLLNRMDQLTLNSAGEYSLTRLNQPASTSNKSRVPAHFGSFPAQSTYYDAVPDETFENGAWGEGNDLKAVNRINDPFKQNDPFENSEVGANVTDREVGDPFADQDPFANADHPSAFDHDPFSDAAADPFSNNTAVNTGEPFTEVKKVPPPRPAPPRSRPQTPGSDPFGTDGTVDPFSNSGFQGQDSTAGGFANFDNFAQFS